jgi:tetratricopeptide (TPR) repeat protein/glycosyltransferase involved in cell wall biosynthesis
MTGTERMSDDELRQIAIEILERAPSGSIPPQIALWLQTPTLVALQAAATALLASGHLDPAEAAFRALREQPGFDDRAAIALARIASRRGDAAAAAIEWRDCLNRFPDRSEPDWFVELARAERQLGRHAEAEEILRRCIERFPKAAAGTVHLAELLSIRGRPEGAAALWQTAMREFSDQAQPWWFKGLGAALQVAGHSGQSKKVLQEMMRRFPGAPESSVLRAQNAARDGDWARALSLWMTCLERHAYSIRPEWLNGRALALFRLLRAEEALDAWQELITRFPDFVHAYRDMAAAFETLGLWAKAHHLWSALVARFPDRVRPEWLARRARCLLHPRPGPAIRLAIAELERQFPDSPLGRKIAIEFAYRMSYSLKTLAPLMADAVHRFPDDRDLLAQYVRLLLGSGRLTEAEAVVQRLEAAQDDHLALISRWRIAMDRDGETAIKESADQAVRRDSWAITPGLAIGDFLLSIWCAWATDLALVLYNNLAKRFPGRLEIIRARARALIVLREDQQALELIDSMPALDQDREMMELRAWTYAHRGDHETARRLWQTILAQYYFPAVHAAEPPLELLTPERVGLQSDGVTVFMSVRDEVANLAQFLRHYRKLGVRRFVAVDNLSSDGSEAYLRAQPDVMLYRTRDDFQASNSGMRWINTLIERHGADGWCLFADADEAFIYPGWESTPLNRLTEYLDREGAEAVAAFMLDVYPERLSDAAGNPAIHDDAQYYDGDYVWIGHVRPPYLRPLGGIRSRLFRAQEYLHKIPLIKSGRGVYIDNHETTPLRLSGVTGVLLHYKLTALAGNYGQSCAMDCGLEVTRRYERYASRLHMLANDDLRLSGVTQSLADSLILSDRGLMRATAEFRAWLNRSEACNPASTDRQTTSRG